MSHSTYYDNWFSSTGRSVTFTLRILTSQIINQLKQYGLKTGQKQSIIELGCGKGWAASQLNQFAQVTAYDMAEKTIQANQERYPEIRFNAADLTTPLPHQNEFDFALSMEVIEHIPYDQQHQLIENAWQTLKPGGYFIITTPNKPFCLKRNVPLFQPVEDILSMDELRKILEEKFTVVDMYTAVYNFKPKWIDAIWKRLFYPINMTIAQRIIKKRNCGYHIIAIARKD